MRYDYVSPVCGQWVWIDWEIRRGVIYCPHWLAEMEDIVPRIRGNRCTVPGCSRYADTLDHRIAWSKGGPTSVANLWPMCSEHKESKSGIDYEVWFDGHTGVKEFQERLHRVAESTKARLAMANGRGNGDSREECIHAHSIPEKPIRQGVKNQPAAPAR